LKSDVLVLADPDSIHTKKWIVGWQQLGYSTTLSGLSSKSYDGKYIFHEEIATTGGNGIKYIKNIFNFNKVLKEVQPKIINAHFMISYGFLSSLIKRKNHLLVLFLPGTDVMKIMEKNAIFLKLSEYVFNKSDLLVSVSNIMTAKILNRFPHLKEKILTQQYGVDIGFLQQFKGLPKEIDIISNRQWKPNSNYEVILEVLDRLSDTNCMLIGNDNSDYSNALMQKYKKLESANVGITKYEKNIECVAKSTVFISLTSSDGIPLSLIEAMYLGAIPIVSNIAPNLELIEDGINGFVVDINVESLEKTVSRVLSLSIEEKKSMQAYNEEIVLEKFDFTKNFNTLEKKIQSL